MRHELGTRRALFFDLGKRWMMPVLRASALLAAVAAAPAAAQQTSGGRGDSKDVIVDLSVLDQLGPATTAPGSGAIVLTPPGGKPAAKPTGKTQPATAGAKARVAAESSRAARAPSSPPPPPPASVTEAPPTAEGSAAAPIAGQPSESPNPAAPAAAAAETSAPPPASPPIESQASPPTGAAPSAAGAASAEPPPAPAAAQPSSTPPAQAAAESAAPATPPPQLANKPSALPTVPSGPHGDKAISLRFDSGAAELNNAARTELGKFAAILKKSNDQRLQVVAYAAGSEGEASQARRLALSRALAVRSYLIEQGISSARMDVRALGNKVEDAGPADRVDLVFIGNK